MRIGASIIQFLGQTVANLQQYKNLSWEGTVEAVMKPNRSKRQAGLSIGKHVGSLSRFLPRGKRAGKRRLSLAIREMMTIASRRKRPLCAVVALAIVCLSFLSVSTSGIAGANSSRTFGGQEFGPSLIGADFNADCNANSLESGETPTPRHHAHHYCLVCAASGCGAALERMYFAFRQIPFVDVILVSSLAWILVELLIPVAPARLRVSPPRAPPSVA